MNWLRDKTADAIRRDALKMIRRKQTAGCAACVDAYVDLARRHGATETEIREALATDGKQHVSAQ